MKFWSVVEFQKTLWEFTIKDGKDITFKKIDLLNMKMLCKQSHWRMHASKFTYDMSFQVKTIGAKHICGKNYNNRQLTYILISDKYTDHIRSDPNKYVATLKDVMFGDLKVEV